MEYSVEVLGFLHPCYLSVHVMPANVLPASVMRNLMSTVVIR